MASERTQRQIDRLLDQAEEAITSEDWYTVASRARAVLALDPENSDGLNYLAAADRALTTSGPIPQGQPEPSRTRVRQQYPRVFFTLHWNPLAGAAAATTIGLTQ